MRHGFLPSISVTAALVTCWSLGAGDRRAWLEVRSPHFVAYTDAKATEAQEALKEFEEIRLAFKNIFPGIRVDSRQPLLVFVHRDEDSMKQLLPQEFEGKNPKRVGGYYLTSRDRNYALLRLDARTTDRQPFHVLFHEFTHGVLHQNFPTMPLWLDEGFAEYYGETRIQSDRVILGAVSRSSLEMLKNGRLLPLATFLKVNHQSPEYREGDKTGVFYAEAWALTHFLLMDEGARKADWFRKYLAALDKNPDPLEAARMAWGDLAAFQAAFYAYTRQSRFHFWNIPLSVKWNDRDFTARSMTEAEVLVAKAEFLRDSGKAEACAEQLKQAFALDPKLPAASVALGVAHLQAGRRDAARESLETAERLGSTDPRTPFLLAQLAVEDQEKGENGRRRMAAWLEVARKLQPENPDVHILLCRFLASEPGGAERALEAGRRALELEPENPHLWANFGYVCMNLNLEAQAKTVGERLAVMREHPRDGSVNDQYQLDLTRFLKFREQVAKTRTVVAEEPSSSGPVPVQRSPLKFSLPNYYASLGQTVMGLSWQGKDAEAIPLVEAALAKAKYDFDRKALRTLLERLKARCPKPSTP